MNRIMFLMALSCSVLVTMVGVRPIETHGPVGVANTSGLNQMNPTNLDCKPRKLTGKGTYAGFISFIQGNECFLQVDNQPPDRLHPRKSIVQFVNVGDKLQCFGGSGLTLQLGGGNPESDASFPLKASDGCYVARQVFVARTSRDKSRYFPAPAGPPRRDSPFCWPTDNATIKPENLIVRWPPQISESIVVLTLTDMTGRVIWEDTADGKKGELLSKDLQERVKEYRNRESNQLKLSIGDSKGRSDFVRFSLLSDRQEEELNKNLASCEEKKDIRRSLCRILAFHEKRMPQEVLKEYELALKLAPESESLISKAEAYRLANSNCPVR